MPVLQGHFQMCYPLEWERVDQKVIKQMPYETLTFRKKAPIATITLNRLDYLNALNLRLCEELLQAVRESG